LAPFPLLLHRWHSQPAFLSGRGLGYVFHSGSAAPNRLQAPPRLVLHIALATRNALTLNGSLLLAPFLGNGAVDAVHYAEHSQLGAGHIAIDQA
jgi:hypothetical protein